MKTLFVMTAIVGVALSSTSNAQPSNKTGHEHLYLDVHHIGPGKVTAADVAGAHQKDLATEKKFNARFLRYWFDESEGNVYCLVSAKDTQALHNTHAMAHGLLPDAIYEVTSGKEALATGKDFYLDVHKLGAGKVTAKAAAAAHEKDLAVQEKYGVKFVNYWVNEKEGVIVCLSQAPDSNAIINAHKEAHGLLPVSVEKVTQGE